ncbi:hypothetical protein AB832_07355 [Flavobacteriaceae bacterium (ex Bugula neritina AB1)]|nr:hypothetical protein AB832_07355 [Flavobacteriaceae bacterium (ex Bugula neritina AB1)]
MIIGLVWVVLTLLCAKFASGRGRSGIIWFIIALFFSPAVAFLLLVFMSDVSIKECPNCRENVKKDALSCRHCQHVFVDNESKELKQEVIEPEKIETKTIDSDFSNSE